MEFNQFWAIWPYKAAKKDAQKAWNQITPEQRIKAVEVIHKHVEYWALRDMTDEFIPSTPLPASWLRGERFDDVIVMPKRRDGFRAFVPKIDVATPRPDQSREIISATLADAKKMLGIRDKP